MNINRRPSRLPANTPSRSAHDLIANAADNVTSAPLNSPYRPYTAMMRGAAR